MEFLNLISVEGSYIDLIVFLLGCVVAGIVYTQHLAIKELRKSLRVLNHRYHQHDKAIYRHAGIIADKLGVKTVKGHRTGDYELINPLDEADL